MQFTNVITLATSKSPASLVNDSQLDVEVLADLESKGGLKAVTSIERVVPVVLSDQSWSGAKSCKCWCLGMDHGAEKATGCECLRFEKVFDYISWNICSFHRGLTEEPGILHSPIRLRNRLRREWDLLSFGLWCSCAPLRFKLVQLPVAHCAFCAERAVDLKGCCWPRLLSAPNLSFFECIRQHY